MRLFWNNVPVILQMEALECGAISLCMVLAYYGCWISSDEARKACGVSRDGASAFNILQAARKFGMQGKGVRLELEGLDKQKNPCILHWGFAHFVVFCGKLGPWYVINDPARGRCYYSRSEVASHFTGICLKMEPSENFQKSGKAPSVVSYIRKHLHGACSALLFTMFTSLLLSLVSVVLPIFQQAFVDGILTGTNPEWATPFLVTLCGVALYQLAVNALAACYGMRQRTLLTIQASSKFMWHVLRLPLHYFSTRIPGDIIRRIDEVGEIPTLLVEKLAPVAANLFLLFFYLFFMVKYSEPLAGIAVASTMLIILLSVVLIQVQRNLSRQVENNQGKLQGVVMSSLLCIETVKAAGAEEGFFQRWAKSFADVKNAESQQNRIMVYAGALPQFLTQLVGNLIFILGCRYILEGQLTIGMLMAFQGFLSAFSAPLLQLVNTSLNLSMMQVNIERIEDVYNTRPDVVPITQDIRDRRDGKLLGKLELKHVTFGYSPLEEPLIRDFSMRVEQGKSVAFVGASGCGKSTLANLVSGLYKPWEGEILYDGQPIARINRATFTSSVAVIDQDSTFLEGTVENNVKLWDQSIEDFAMIIACNDAEIHQDIALRPKAYDSVMEEGGKNFSGGQRQRLNIATALVKEPVVLIMDEATSALDAATEERVMKNIKQLGITLVIIAHRLSSIRDCDEIIVMDKGAIVERGTHEELLANKKRYYELVADL